MINIVLYRPEMPENAGNIIRLCVNCGAKLHMVGPLGFFMDNRRLMRAGLDYHHLANLTVHNSFASFMDTVKPQRLIASSSKGTVPLPHFAFKDDDYVIFGREKEGLAQEVYAVVPEELRIRIPMMPESRCINLSNSVAIVAYAAFAALGWQGAIL